MSKRSKKSIRFGITDGSGKRAATWNCLTNIGAGKSDVYLICRQLRDDLKVSLHQTGEWHIAYSKKFVAENPEFFANNPLGRYIGKWRRPSEIASGVTLAIRIITPHSAVNTPIVSLNRTITWIPVSPPGQAVEICIFITSPNALVSSWPGRNRMKTKLVGSMVLDNGEKTWIVYRGIECPDFEDMRGTPRYLNGRSRDDLKGKGLRIFAHKIHKEDGSLVILDGAVVPATPIP
jgi:hypothetical protein